MSAAPQPLIEVPRAVQQARQQLYRRVYPMRVLGMGLGGLAIAGVLHMQRAAPWLWGLMVLTCLVWPQVARERARRSRDPYRAEQHNLLVDSAIAGMWVPLMHFSLLTSVVLITVTTFDKLSTGIRGLWLRSLPPMFGAMALAALLLRPPLQLRSDFLVELCVLPLLVVHTLGTSITSFRLIRTIARQNRLLEDARRIDAQTGLLSREYWLERAAAVATSRRSGVLLMIDIDRFKSINDSFGHAVGDEAIAAVAAVIRNGVRQADAAGRLGGDEFAVVCADTQPSDAQQIAERICAGVRAIDLPSAPGLRLTCSIGLAPADAQQPALEQWLHRADSALYAAKQNGRDRVFAVSPSPRAETA